MAFLAFLRNTLRSGIALKPVQAVEGAAPKPGNQRQARGFAHKMRNRRH